MNTVFWVRHGENKANLTKEFSHKHVDYSLTEKGILQAQQNRRFPDGEDYHQLLERTQRGLRKALHDKQDARVIIVGHGGMLSFTICDLCPNADPAMIVHTATHNCSISQLDFSDSSPPGILRIYNEFSHLEGEAAR